ncbi:MAG: beta-lactamase family protein, partial [Candidatus Hydrogenedentes bacterium]|nr:beta-lactamase family protein [Candidatus Hydrogenedentota bacterium]
DIVEFCKRTYQDKWQKRFAEDLVEVMTAMGHAPGDTVKLEVVSVTPPIGKVTKEVPMTAANRNAVRKEAEKREQFEEWKATNDRAKNQPRATLSELVPSLRREHKLVGLAAMVMTGGEVIESAADGERKSGSDVAVTIEDQWHLGSITKSITATMIARLIEAGKMKWDDTVGEILSEASIHEEWKAVTLRQLLTHTSGAPANFPTSVMFKRPKIGADSTAARREAVLKIIAEKPETKPGTVHCYSNVGFTIAGAMAEKVTGESWDALVKREVFDPLSLTSAGFGPPTSVDKKLEQPQGHTSVFGWKVGAGEEADNTFIIGPAGIVHMTLQDLCNYATEHLRGERGDGKLLKAETYEMLHRPELDDYACGWVRVEARPRIPHTHYWHNGSNTMWYALVVFIPDTNMVVAVASNDGDIANAESAAWKVVENSAKPLKVVEQK